jgi:hypothetical protein
MNNANMLKPALVGGVAIGILSALPVIGSCNCVCCAWAICGGILASYLFVRESQMLVTMGRGALAGLAAGAIGAVVCVLFSIPMQLVVTGGGNSAMIAEQIQDLLAKNPELPQELRERIEDILLRGNFMMLLQIFSFFFNIVFFPLLAMLGGAIGVAIFEKRKPGDPPSNLIAPPPQPPVDQPTNPF